MVLDVNTAPPFSCTTACTGMVWPGATEMENAWFTSAPKTAAPAVRTAVTTSNKLPDVATARGFAPVPATGNILQFKPGAPKLIVLSIEIVSEDSESDATIWLYESVNIKVNAPVVGYSS